MWLTLAQERFPQAHLSGTFVDYMAPSLDCQEKPAFLKLYEESTWRREDMTLLEFLRKTNDKGEVIHHIRAKHQDLVMEEVRRITGDSVKDFLKRRRDLLAEYREHRSLRKARGREPLPLTELLADRHDYLQLTTLEVFANSYTCRGEKLAAVTFHSMLNDRYYGQWLAMHRPFRRLEEFAEAAL